MRRILLVFTLFFALTTISFGQEFKKATASSFKKYVVGKTFKDNQTRITFKKNGSLEAIWQGQQAAIVKGNYTFSNSEGYCRVATVTTSSGNVRQRPRQCWPFYIKGNSTIRFAGYTYKLQK